MGGTAFLVLYIVFEGCILRASLCTSFFDGKVSEINSEINYGL